MDEYEIKFAEMQKFIPFVEKMIERLQNVTDKSREDQLKKMQQLHGILTSSRRQLKIEVLQKCEVVLQKLYRRMGKRASAGLNAATRETREHSSSPSDVSASTNHRKSEQPIESRKVTSLKKMDETPASPSPPTSPYMANKSSVISPIMIPTERTNDHSHKTDSKPASPDESETVATKDPIIIPTERKDGWSEQSQLNAAPHSLSKIGSSGTHKASDTKSHPRSILSVTNSSSSSRRIFSVEKTRVEGTSSDDVPEVIQIDSPTKQTRLTSTESRNISNKNPTSLLASPPPELNAPPLSMEDLAELLDENTDSDKIVASHREKENHNRFMKERIQEDTNKSGNERRLNKGSISDHMNSDAESERRWEEVDKHIVKLTTRKSLSSVVPTTATGARIEAPKADTKSSTPNLPSKLNFGDSRNVPVSPSTKSSERNAEPRYTDNYERYPRHSREPQSDTQSIPMPDMNVINSAFSNLSEGDIANLVQTNLHIRSNSFLHIDDRNPTYQRRTDQHQQRPGPSHIGSHEPEFRRENSEFYDPHPQTPKHHPPGAAGYPASAQWPLNPNMRGHIHGPESSPRQYQHANNVSHPDMWNMAPNSGPLDGHPHHHIPNQFGLVPNRGMRSLMSPPTDRPYADDMPLSPPPPPPPALIPSLMASPTFPPNSQYRGFPPENRPFERTGEYPHVPPRPQWDHQSNRGNDPNFDRPGEYPHIPPRQSQWESSTSRPAEGVYDRSTECPQSEFPSRPSQWEHESNYHDSSRLRGPNDNCYGRTSNVEPPLWGRSNVPEVPNRNTERGRGSERFPNERNRPGETIHSNFSRSRPSERDRQSQNDLSNRYRDRDPRCRTESSTTQSTSIPSASIPRRDPRLSKDIPTQSPAISKTKEPPAPTPIAKPKDPPTISKRDPRRRTIDMKDSHKSKNSSKPPHRSRSRSIDRSRELTKHSSGKTKRDSSDHKSSAEKQTKDVETMQSPLESLYGVIDTTAKTGKGYGLQKFKIPKIRRTESVPRPPTPPKPNRHAVDEEEWTSETSVPSTSPKTDSSIKSKNNHDEKKAEVTSTTEEVVDFSIPVSSAEMDHDPKSSDIVTTSKELSVQSKKNKKGDDKVDMSKTTIDTSSVQRTAEPGTDAPQETQFKDPVTQELIEALIRKSLESGEGKKLFEQAKLLQQLVDTKRYKKIEKIINGDYDSGSSCEEDSTMKKTVTKKKRRVIVSDSSDEECLADRIGVTSKKAKKNKAATKEMVNEDKVDAEKDEADQKNIDDEDGTTNKIGNTAAKKQKKSKKAKTKKLSDTVEELEEPKEVPTKPPAKTAKKRRNSLEMLQEDIREMFICEGVVTATGHRMCRVMKEAEGNLSSVNVERKAETSSVYASSSPDRQDDIRTDEDEASPKATVRSSNRTVKNSDVEGSPKSKLRSRKGRKRATKVSKDVLLSSDSEAERTSRDATAADSDTSVATVKNSTLNQSTSSLPDASDDFGPILRRSERVAMKEPRVLIEKADLSKIDSSKIMFDTSSDESFGIDVSELTAAVDISLHSERQATDDGSNSITGSLKKIPDKAMRSRKKNLHESSDSKRDSLAAFDDDVSMTSDISTLSGVGSNVSKKNTSNSSHENTNKELIGDMLGNLSDEKMKETISINSEKHSDIEGDEERDVSATDDSRKPQSKVKKKRCRWQMGFVPKCKKKKSGNSSITDTTTVGSDKNTTSSLGESNEVEGASVVPITEAALHYNEADQGKLNLSSKDVDNDSTKIKDEKESSVSQIKTENRASEVYASLNLNEIIEYAWTGQERYKCLLCQFNGKHIVHHYKINHPGEEIMISRLTLLDARRAIDEAKDETFIKLSRKVNSGPRRKFSCRFCVFTNEGVKRAAMESFYEHCSTHTGEYRFSCRNCDYQTISRASMKPHYYKVCRKSTESFAIGIAEDAIPSDQYISGYLCSVCNYIQLKECNVRLHVATIHKNLSDVEIIKINMSGYFDTKYNEELNHPFDEAISLKVESDTSFNKESEADSRVHGNEKDESNSDIEILDKTTDEVSPKRNKSALKVVQDEGDNLPSNKLNAFVCPPELEDKQVEIELERKKKMQEILNNMGRNFQKPLSDGGLSIIDKLKNKMTTDLHNVEHARIEIDNVSEPTIVQDTRKSSELPAGEMSQSSHQLEEHNKDPKPEPIDDPASISMREGEMLKNQGLENGSVDSDKVEKKMKDPLTSLQNDERKDDDTEHEGSDNEPIAGVGRSYESDSSEEMTDTELPTDVHSLLQAAGTINTSTTNVPMMTTIQRLAAQLQGAKNFAAVNNDNIDEGKNQEDQETMGDEASQDAAADSPVNAMNPNAMDFTNDPSTSMAVTPVQSQAEDGPRNFIRLRRLSGDKLSIPEPSSLSCSSTTENSPLGTNENSSDLLSAEVLHSSLEDDCSFLKIENVISLAETTASSSSEVSPAGNDMRGTVTTSSGKAMVSVLTKLRPVGNFEGLLGRLPPIAPAPPKCFKLSNVNSNKNVKFVKIFNSAKPLRELTTLKQKDPGQISSTPKLKTVDAYNNMLSPTKLRHLYKCMGRSCDFTSDSVEAFGRHYQHHANAVDRSTATAPYDFEKCAYCSESLSTWDDMRAHFKLKHTFCSFQCSYCFYRAFTQSYVELHQNSSHPGKPTSVILGMKDYHPSEMIDKRENIIPIICKHECNKIFYVPEAFVAHLRSKHGPTLSIFKCHICPTTTLKAEQLISHYKLHSIYKYQCLYCLFGADGPMELHHHLSLMHCNRPPKILERSLPPEPVRDMDVLLQLIIRNLDATFKCSELKIIPESSSPDNVAKTLSKRRKRAGPTANPGELVLAGGGKSIKILPGPLKLVGHEVIDLLESADKSSCSQRNNIFLNLADTLRAAGSLGENKKLTVVKIDGKTASESLSKPSITVRLNDKLPGDARNSMDEHNSPTIESTEHLVAHHEPELELRYVSEHIKSKVANAIDPLRLSESDEFININFLDNPEILKSAEQFSVKKDSGTSKTLEVTNDDDSDIEILEHIQHTDDSARKKSVPATVPEVERPVPVIGKKNEEEDEQTKIVTSEKRMEVVCSSAENADNSDEPSVPIEKADVKGKFQGPLTLNDIRDTGFTGRDLYKCGYTECKFSTSLATSLKSHIKQCVHANERKEFSCIHCSKRFVKIAYLLEHFKIHGLKRFGCSLCTSRFATPHQAISHMKFRHKIHNSKLMPADPTNPSADGLFVIHPHKGLSQKYRGKKGGKSKSSSDKKRGKEENTTFSPTDIDALPRQPIYNREVQCAICPYKTKVRSNIIRHLQLHAKDETVPESGPVNPVPCLDKKERMFDKMVNLASSSHQNGRMGGTVKETITASESDGLPKYVPEQKRYVCGVADCNYLTVDETMLRYHSKALHPDEVNFRCPHCPSQSPGQEAPQTIPIDKMGVHLKMHDTRLYKCSHCNHHHYHRHVVERHMTDKHAEQRPYVKIIREIENTENSQPSPAQEEPEEGPADRDGNYWKCNLCEYKCVYKSEMVTHAGSVHNEKSQFKCSLCVFKTTAKISLEQHIMSKHVNDSDCAFVLTFERIKGPKPTAVESTQNDEPFDTTPLWRRDMPRIRHIRGILLEEEGETSLSTETPTKSGKRKSDGDIVTKSAKIKVKSMSFDGSNAIENKGKSETKTECVDNTAGTSPTTASSLSNQATVISQLNTPGLEPVPSDSSEAVSSLGKGKYGAYVEPNGNFYVCSLCPSYKSKFRQDMKDHLYRDLKYWRFHCKSCGFLTVSQSLLTKHINRQHKDRKPECVAIEPNPEIESWVQTFLSKQLAVMRGATKTVMDPVPPPTSKSSLSRNVIKSKPPTITLEDIIEIPVEPKKSKCSPSILSSSAKKIMTESPSAMPSSTITTTETAKTVDLTEAISSLQAINSTQMSIDSDDDDDGDALVIDSKDDLDEENKDVISEDTTDLKIPLNETEVPEKIYVCKHCDMKFSRWRGFKLHVQINHLKRLGFLCPYCDRSTNSEPMMRQHIRTKHIGRTEHIVHNPAAGGPELSDAFWEQEYGLIRPKKIKKRKPKQPYSDSMDPPEDTTEKNSTPETCSICGFTALNFTGLKVHMRTHANKHSLKCVHCSFATNSKSEVWQHSEINHPNVEWRAQEINAAGSSEGQPIHQYTKTLGEEDYSGDIEEEPIPESFEHKIIHGCFYCNLRSASLDSVKKHWSLVHKELKESSEQKTGVPFRYKEIPVTTISHHKLMKCAYCPKKGSLTMLRGHCRKKHSNVPLKFTEAIDRSQDIWVCKWCNESCEANTRTAHHTMFHSHLPVRFRKEHEMQVMQKGYVCPECSFVSVSLTRMKTHAAKHYDTFRCKRCDSTFASIVLATQHSTREHPGLSANIEGFATNIDLIMARVSETDCAGIVSNTIDEIKPTPSNDIFRNLGVAKKSTTKQIIRSPSTSPSKSVARKSTNPLPRYPPGLVFDIDNISSDSEDRTVKSISYYGLPREPVELSNLNTTMVVGSAQMKVKCNTLAQIINIEPRVILKDINKIKK